MTSNQQVATVRKLLTLYDMNKLSWSPMCLAIIAVLFDAKDIQSFLPFELKEK